MRAAPSFQQKPSWSLKNEWTGEMKPRPRICDWGQACRLQSGTNRQVFTHFPGDWSFCRKHRVSMRFAISLWNSLYNQESKRGRNHAGAATRPASSEQRIYFLFTTRHTVGKCVSSFRRSLRESGAQPSQVSTKTNARISVHNLQRAVSVTPRLWGLEWKMHENQLHWKRSSYNNARQDGYKQRTLKAQSHSTSFYHAGKRGNSKQHPLRLAVYFWSHPSSLMLQGSMHLLTSPATSPTGAPWNPSNYRVTFHHHLWSQNSIL